MRKLHEEYAALKEYKSRESVKAVKNRISFQVNIDNLLDIAHQDAMQLMTIKEDRDFLKARRKTGRKGKMSGAEVDADWVFKEKRKRKMKKTERLKRENNSHSTELRKLRVSRRPLHQVSWIKVCVDLQSINLAEVAKQSYSMQKSP